MQSFYSRLTTEIDNYLTKSIEISEGVKFSQYSLIKRIMKFKNRDLAGTKLDDDLRYIYYFDIITPRINSEVKNLRIDTKHILAFSDNPKMDFPAVFIANASLRDWMTETGEGDRLNAAVEEFTGMGNVGFKKISDGYEIVDFLNTYITNQTAETVDETDIIERYEMGASQMKAMGEWDQDKVDEVIKNLKNQTFSASPKSQLIESTSPKYEIFEFTGEVSEKEYNEVLGKKGGNEHKFFLAKIIVAGIKKSKTGLQYVLFCEKLTGKMSDHYIYAHRGKYDGRFWRVGMYELLFDHQIRANEIGNQLARGLEWASKVVFRSSSSKILQNIRADLDNGDVIIDADLQQVNVRLQGLDQLMADWNRNLRDADVLSNSLEVVRGESLPSGTPFRLGMLIDTNAGKLFVVLRQKLTVPYKRVFREWILPQLIKDLNGEKIFRIVGDQEIINRFRQIMVENWYVRNLARFGPHTLEIAQILKEAKLRELQETDPTIKNSKEIWKGVLKRLKITITGENLDIDEQMETIGNLLQFETDPIRRAWLLDRIYSVKGLPVPPMMPTMAQGQQRPAGPEEKKEGFQLNQEQPLMS